MRAHGRSVDNWCIMAYNQVRVPTSTELGLIAVQENERDSLVERMLLSLGYYNSFQTRVNIPPTLESQRVQILRPRLNPNATLTSASVMTPAVRTDDCY